MIDCPLQNQKNPPKISGLFHIISQIENYWKTTSNFSPIGRYTRILSSQRQLVRLNRIYHLLTYK